jgi:deoxyribodipyrimidine photo-lyase
MTDMAASWISTRKAGMSRLAAFVPRAGRSYARLRNFDRGAGGHDHVSVLSPWIRHRLVTEREVIAAVLAEHSLKDAEKFIQEICWRTYWKGWLERHPAVWSEYQAEVNRLSADALDNPDLASRLEIARNGETGIDCFDSWVGELVRTGYLHNHARMWFASIWIFTLDLPWELGADLFLRHLIDGDPASNTLSWRWVAGLQTRGKIYLARPSNIDRYTEGRFPAVKGLVSHAVPPKASLPPVPLAAPGEADRDPVEGAGLLLTEEDLSPDFLTERGWRFASALAVQAARFRSPDDTSSMADEFARGGLSDALARVETRHRAAVIQAAEDIEGIVAWAKRQGLRCVVTPYVPVGPTADALAGLKKALQAEGFGFHSPMRMWDRRAWPACEAGVFRFWNKAGRHLAAESGPEMLL